jgi:hypothetical protein
MTETPSAQRDINRRQLRKRTELSLAIPIVGIFFLVSPLLNSFTQGEGQSQYAHVITYVFGIWGILILGAFLMSRLLSDDVDDD